MLLDDARTAFAVAPRLPWLWLRHYIDPTLGGDSEKAKAEKSTELFHAGVGFAPDRVKGMFVQCTPSAKGRSATFCGLPSSLDFENVAAPGCSQTLVRLRPCLPSSTLLRCGAPGTLNTSMNSWRER